MHRLWLVSELTDQVVKACAPTEHTPYASPDKESCLGFSTLYALARTCRILSEPSLDALWYTRIGLYHLFMCLPNDLQESIFASPAASDEMGGEERTIAYGGYLVDFGHMRKQHTLKKFRDLNSEDWERFDFYARRIRHLDCTRTYPGEKLVPYEIYEELCRKKGDMLLPNIRSIIWGPRSFVNAFANPAAPLQYLVPPNLSSLDLEHSSLIGEGVYESLASLATLTPGLRYLRLSIRSAAVHSQKLRSIIEKWHALREFSLKVLAALSVESFCLDLWFLNQLSSLPRLSQLDIRAEAVASKPDHRRLDSSSNGPVIFSELRSLSIETYELSSVTAALHDCRCPSLDSIDIGIGPQSKPEDITTLITILPSLSALTKVTVRMLPPFGNPASTKYVIPGTVLYPLKELRNLVSLVISLRSSSGGVGISITDLEWESLVRAWPQLHTLHVVGAHIREIFPEIPGPSCKALTLLARHCHELVDIGICLGDAADIAPSSEDVLPAGTHRAVRLNLYDSIFCDLHLAASWINAAFPYGSVMTRTVPRSHRNTLVLPQTRAERILTDRDRAAEEDIEWEELGHLINGVRGTQLSAKPQM